MLIEGACIAIFELILFIILKKINKKYMHTHSRTILLRLTHYALPPKPRKKSFPKKEGNNNKKKGVNNNGHLLPKISQSIRFGGWV